MDVHKDIMTKLLKLRITFLEYPRINKAYKVDFKLLDINVKYTMHII
jgi:hypothetical protein